MKLQRLERQQILKGNMQEIWTFFADPCNLEKITPEWMHFDIRSGHGHPMFQGQILAYRIKAIAGIPMTWITEITHVKEGEYFVDEQRFGPYRFWHHLHRFSPCDGGILMEDRIHYALPMDPFSRAVHPFIRKKLEAVFDYRKGAIQLFF
ncbi:ligand-binding SRPBCC domain-containing protein [Desulfobotulus alkaliphilus]|uniref:Ligand-binding SRPBCC domain-containing protein n=1 Tax=Desulfobotulus alkaliphilus TaxID=622671 RepID=A0A562RRJ3_9BACT|nr:SRPBCC family protein [Desulfobotulus alkaliphilus]TWI71134.1 ligand-binding SRPBCC domain-containing protein [Desulfobotulus alkaliphilus]